MRRDMHLDQRVARLSAAETRLALALEPQHLAIGDPGRDRHVEPLVRRERQTLPPPGRRLDKADRQRIKAVLPRHPKPALPGAAGPPALAIHREQVFEVLDVHLALRRVFSALRALGMRAVRITWPLGAALVDLPA